MPNEVEHRADGGRFGDAVNHVIAEFAIVLRCTEAVGDMLDDKSGEM